MAHLKLDHRGFPVPFFCPIIDGKPDFRLLDERKQRRCVEEKLCGVCGKKLHKDYHYFVSGPLGLKNEVSTDPAMHRECAEFSLQVCPHLVLQKADRRHTGIEHTVDTTLKRDLMTLDKPTELYLIKSRKYVEDKRAKDQLLIKYKKVSSERYIYIDGKLKKESDGRIENFD